MLNPVHLRTLHAVLRTGSFADAARELNYTGSAVSQQITALERQVGTPLFERERQGVRATPAAHFIGERSLDVLGQLQALDDDVALLREGGIGQLRLGSFPTASERLLPEALSLFRQERPDVQVRLDEGEEAELTPLLMARELDVAITYRYGLVPRRHPRGFRSERLLVEDLIVLMPADHSLLGGPSSITMDQLEQETWITPRLGTPGAAMMRRLCANAGFTPDIVYRTNNYATAGGLVRAGMGIALVPALGHTPQSGVVGLQLADHGARREVMAVRAPATTEGAWRSMVQALHRAAATLANNAPGVSLPTA